MDVSLIVIGFFLWWICIFMAGEWWHTRTGHLPEALKVWRKLPRHGKTRYHLRPPVKLLTPLDDPMGSTVELIKWAERRGEELHYRAFPEDRPAPAKQYQGYVQGVGLVTSDSPEKLRRAMQVAADKYLGYSGPPPSPTSQRPPRRKDDRERAIAALRLRGGQVTVNELRQAAGYPDPYRIGGPIHLAAERSRIFDELSGQLHQLDSLLAAASKMDQVPGRVTEIREKRNFVFSQLMELMGDIDAQARPTGSNNPFEHPRVVRHDRTCGCEYDSPPAGDRDLPGDARNLTN